VGSSTSGIIHGYDSSTPNRVLDTSGALLDGCGHAVYRMLPLNTREKTIGANEHTTAANFWTDP
jgi:hypothetical protein